MSNNRIAVPQHLEADDCGTFTVDETAKLLRVGRKAVYRAAHTGEIPVIKIGKRILISRVQLKRLLNGEIEMKG